MIILSAGLLFRRGVKIKKKKRPHPAGNGLRKAVLWMSVIECQGYANLEWIKFRTKPLFKHR